MSATKLKRKDRTAADFESWSTDMLFAAVEAMVDDETVDLRHLAAVCSELERRTGSTFIVHNSIDFDTTSD